MLLPGKDRDCLQKQGVWVPNVNHWPLKFSNHTISIKKSKKGKNNLQVKLHFKAFCMIYQYNHFSRYQAFLDLKSAYRLRTMNMVRSAISAGHLVWVTCEEAKHN